MPLPIEDYALIGNTRTAGLVGRNGSLDWLCLPRFDAPACFAALLGSPEHGRWLIAPSAPIQKTRRCYRASTLILETTFETEQGEVQITDFMPHWESQSDMVRLVTGLRGRVELRMELIVRFGYGEVVPWVLLSEDGMTATSGPDALQLHTQLPLQQESDHIGARFELAAGEKAAFTLAYFPSHCEPPLPIDPYAACTDTAHWWQKWCKQSTYDGLYAEQVGRSLITLKALTHSATGGIIAAPTTSLPEYPGGNRNWDYRFCWLRDATFTLYALLTAGYIDEARAWREWLLRAAAGRPEDLQIVYGIAGERRLTELELPWLPGYRGASPVRIGNAAFHQQQLDVYGEVFDTLHLLRRAGLEPNVHAWELQKMLLDFLEGNWSRPDHGIWEVRGPKRHFTHSKVMAWIAFDRAVKAVQRFSLEGPDQHWIKLRQEIHREICSRGYDAGRGSFVQHYGSKALDASLLMLPLVGFLPASDPRIRGTVRAIEDELMAGGLVRRYLPDPDLENLHCGEGVFLPCSFWLVDNLIMLGRKKEAQALFERLLGLCNDLGLISEEYDVENQCMLGNFPQAFTHVALINSARNLTRGGGPGEDRGNDDPESDIENQE